MRPAPACCRRAGADLILTLHVQPRAPRSAFAGQIGEALRIRLAAPPVEGRANAELVCFLAEAFGVPQRRVQLLTGENARRKTARIAQPNRYPAGLPPLQDVDL